MEYTIGTKVFGDWEIIAEIGEGSYGKVYQLRKENFGISTNGALKVIQIPRSHADVKDALSQGMDEQSVTSYFKGVADELMREVAVMSDMKSHPNVVGCQDYDIIPHTGGIGWDILIRMDLLTPLQEYQTRYAMDETQVRRLGADLCEALIYCQKRGLIHRDIKPGNIFVDELGRFRLGDFGVARTADKTMGGMSKQGTENYMAPEVYLGREYGPTVDIYSLGMVLYQLMNANRLPFYPLPPAPIEFSHRFEVLKKRMSGAQMPPPCKASEDFAAIILKACAFESKDRYRSAADLLEAIQGRRAEPAYTYEAPPAPQPPVDEPVPSPQASFSFEQPTGDETIGPAFTPRRPKAEAQPTASAKAEPDPGFGAAQAVTEVTHVALEIGEKETKISFLEPSGQIRTLTLRSVLGYANGMWHVGEDAMQNGGPWIQVLGASNTQRKSLTGHKLSAQESMEIYLEQVLQYAYRNGIGSVSADGAYRITTQVDVIVTSANILQFWKECIQAACQKKELGSPRICSLSAMSALRFCTKNRPQEGAYLFCHLGNDRSEVTLAEYGDDMLEILFTAISNNFCEAMLTESQQQTGNAREAATGELFSQLMTVIQRAQQEYTDHPVRQVILSGELTALPVVPWRLGALLEQEPVIMENPSIAAVEGGAVQSAILQGNPRFSSFAILNIVAQCYGVLDKMGKCLLKVERGTTIPVKQSVKFFAGENDDEIYLTEGLYTSPQQNPRIGTCPVRFQGWGTVELTAELDGIIRWKTIPGPDAEPRSEKQAQPTPAPQPKPEKLRCPRCGHHSLLKMDSGFSAFLKSLVSDQNTYMCLQCKHRFEA